jgi:D-alanyl-D-alanine carboxypeptidase (penicillin-binding protein 5/6)
MMNLDRTRSHNHQAKKHRRLLVIGISTVLLLLVGAYCASNFFKDMETHTTKTVSPKVVLSKDVQLAWPAVGQAAIGSVEDGVLAYSSAIEEQLPTASMAKVITALAILEKQPLELGQTGKSYTLSSKDVAIYRSYVDKNGSVVPVHAGMVVTQYQALQMMLIASSNNMSDTLVERVFGSEEAYISYAQTMLRRMGLTQTIVTDASGFSSATVSTPSELVAIGIAALKNPVIAEIVSQPQVQIPSVGTIKNTNELLGTDGVIGIKTGTTNEAGSCLLFAARYSTESGQKVIIVGVIMGDANAASLFDDSKNLLASAKQGFNLAETQPTGRERSPR